MWVVALGPHGHAQPLPPGALRELLDVPFAAEETALASGGLEHEALEVAEAIEQQPRRSCPPAPRRRRVRLVVPPWPAVRRRPTCIRVAAERVTRPRSRRVPLEDGMPAGPGGIDSAIQRSTDRCSLLAEEQGLPSAAPAR